MDLPSCIPENGFLVDTYTQKSILTVSRPGLIVTNITLWVVVSNGMPNKNSFITEEGKLNGKNSKHIFSQTESNPKITVSFFKRKRSYYNAFCFFLGKTRLLFLGYRNLKCTEARSKLKVFITYKFKTSLWMLVICKALTRIPQLIKNKTQQNPVAVI